MQSTALATAALGALLCVGAPASSAWAQAPDSVEAAVAAIRGRVATIQRDLGRYDSTIMPYESVGGPGAVTAHRDGGALRKLVVRFDGDGASSVTEYFYWDDAPVFSYRRWERFPEEGPSRTSEDRWYISGGRALRWVRTEEDGTRRVVAPTDAAFARAAEAFLTSAACWRRFAEAAARDTPSC